MCLLGAALARRYDPLHSPLEFGAWQHDFAVTCETADADIGAYAHDPPGNASARMLLAHLHDIADC